jgi:hypothetical protein
MTTSCNNLHSTTVFAVSLRSRPSHEVAAVLVVGQVAQLLVRVHVCMQHGVHASDTRCMTPCRSLHATWQPQHRAAMTNKGAVACRGKCCS